MLITLEQDNVLSISAFFDGARLDDFVCNSAVSGMLRFEGLSNARFCRELLPIFAVCVKYGKDDEDCEMDRLSDKRDDHMYMLFRMVSELLTNGVEIPKYDEFAGASQVHTALSNM